MLTPDISSGYGLDALGCYAYTAGVRYGDRVKALRKERGWSRAELARRSDLDSQTIYRIESGRIKDGHKSRVNLSKAFGITLDELSGLPPKGAIPNADVVNPFASLAEADLVATIIALVKEIERRRDSHDLPPAPPPEPHPPSHTRRHRESPRSGLKPDVDKTRER